LNYQSALVFVRWVSASSGLVCLLLYLPLVFRESYISHKELDYIKTTSSKADKVGTKGWDLKNRAQIFKLLRSPGIDSKASIPLAFEDWRTGTITLFLLGFQHPKNV
jgi:hypothetical protein